MLTKEKILKLCKEALSASQFIVDVKINNANDVFIYIDGCNGLTIEECKRISHYIESNIGEIEENFSLEVGSPGLSNPFKVKEQYVKNLNKKIEVITKDAEKIEGTLLEISEDYIIVETSEIKKIENKKQEIKEQQKIEFINIKTAKNIIFFK